MSLWHYRLWGSAVRYEDLARESLLGMVLSVMANRQITNQAKKAKDRRF